MREQLRCFAATTILRHRNYYDVLRKAIRNIFRLLCVCASRPLIFSGYRRVTQPVFSEEEDIMGARIQYYQLLVVAALVVLLFGTKITLGGDTGTAIKDSRKQ